MSENNEYNTPLFQGIKNFWHDVKVFTREAKIRWSQESSSFFTTASNGCTWLIGLAGTPVAIDAIIGAYNATLPQNIQIHLPEALHGWIIQGCAVLAAVGTGAKFAMKFTMKGTPVNEAVKENDPEPPITPVLPYTEKKKAEEDKK